MTASWCAAEIPRYFFYLYTLIQQHQYGVGSAVNDTISYPLKWIRYSLFLVLYPTGISGEVLSIIHSLPYIRQHHILSIHMPNAFNLAIEYYYVCLFILLKYVLGSYIMYTHMLRARGKALGTAQRLKAQ